MIQTINEPSAIDEMADQGLQAGEQGNGNNRQRQQTDQDANAREPFDRHGGGV
jgi:hypothetical protein